MAKKMALYVGFKWYYADNSHTIDNFGRGKRPEENVAGRLKKVIHCLFVFRNLLHIVFLKI